MSRSIWSVLGIAAGAETSTIRRAYAQKLKATHPEDDPEGFQALRAAYEQAMKIAKHRAENVAAWAEKDLRDDEEEGYADGEAIQAPPVEATPIDDAPRTSRPQLEPRREPPRDERGEALAAHQEACHALMTLIVAEPPVAADQLRAALQRVLKSPAIDELRVHADTEGWLAYVLLQHAPRADALIAPVIAYFGWQGRETRRDTPHEILALLARRGDLDLLAEVQKRGHKFHDAYLAFLTPPRSKGLQSLATYWSAERVRLFLSRMNQRRPSMLELFDPALIESWRLFLKGFKVDVRRVVGAVSAVGVLVGVVLAFMVLGGVFSTPYERLLKRVEWAPKSAEPRVALCRYRARMNVDRLVAVEGCDEALSLDPDSLTARDSRAQILLLDNALDEAKAEYGRILALSPNDPRALFGLGLVLQRQGQGDAGATLMSRARALEFTVDQAFQQVGLVPTPPLDPSTPFQTLLAEPYGWARDTSRMRIDTRPGWSKPPSAETMARFYPQKANSDGVEGEALITCRVRLIGKVDDCYIVSQSPFDSGFGEAALKLAKTFEMTPASYEGQPVDNAPVSIPIKFTRP